MNPYNQPQPIGFNLGQQPPMQPMPPYGYNPQGYPPPNSQNYVPQNMPMQNMPMQNMANVENLMPLPQVNFNCPPGLEYLTQIDKLFVKQKVELLEAFIGFETKNKYSVKNSLGQKIYSAKEDNDCCTRNFCGTTRPFNMEILDHEQRRVLTIDRPLRCQSCFFFCCLQTLTVYDAQNNILGYVEQSWSLLSPYFKIKNASGQTVLKITGPFCTFSICGNVEFQVLSRDKSVQVGKISKEWGGVVQEYFTDADNFGISFPLDLDVKIKAVLLGAVFLIDFMFFEKKGNKESDRPGML